MLRTSYVAIVIGAAGSKFASGYTFPVVAVQWCWRCDAGILVLITSDLKPDNPSLSVDKSWNPWIYPSKCGFS